MLEPAAFDILGIGAFAFITVAAAWALKTDRPLPRWVLGSLFLIGIAGFIVDGTIVHLTYLRP